ncbi:MAG: RluA family pseudouridine synthase [Spirochaetota bacterium]|nr:RluA family pseudouridine synthase [Spirochaetota bacterium]
MGDVYQFIVQEEDIGKRLDLFLEKKLTNKKIEISRSFLQNYFENVLINNERKKKNYRVKQEDIVQFSFPDIIQFKWSPERVDFDIVYEDDSLIIVNKPAGLVVHPAKGHYSGTLVHGLLHKLKEFDVSNNKCLLDKQNNLGEDLQHLMEKTFAFNERPGIVHRLDKETSGLLIVAKNPVVQRKLVELFKNRLVDKYYYALVKGKSFMNGKIDKPIIRHPFHRKKFKVADSGKESLTQYKVINYYLNYSLVEVKLITGRTHQIRVHFSSIGHPVVGDSVYSKPKNPFEQKGLALCAKKLSFTHPMTNKRMDFEIELPSYFQEMINEICLS